MEPLGNSSKTPNSPFFPGFSLFKILLSAAKDSKPNKTKNEGKTLEDNLHHLLILSIKTLLPQHAEGRILSIALLKQNVFCLYL